MHCVTKNVLVPYRAAQMFELVDDVEAYPQFLPWCAGARVVEQLDNRKTARIDIDYHRVRAHFTTDNVNRPPDSIVITLNDGPIVFSRRRAFVNVARVSGSRAGSIRH